MLEIESILDQIAVPHPLLPQGIIIPTQHISISISMILVGLTLNWPTVTLAPPTHMPIYLTPSPPSPFCPYKKHPSSPLSHLLITSHFTRSLIYQSHMDRDVAVKLEDDLFLEELSRQISVLITDEDEDPLPRSSPEPLQGFSGVVHPPPLSVILYEQALVRRESKGTGVFIPQSTQPRRKHKRGKSAASYAKNQKQSEDTRKASQLPSNHSFRSRNG